MSRPRKYRICIEEGCEGYQMALDLCQKHYSAMYYAVKQAQKRAKRKKEKVKK